MSKTKIIEGIEYIQKEHVDEIVRQRISKYSEKLTAAESKISQYEAQIDEVSAKSGLVDSMTQQMEQMKVQLEQANSRYDRHTVISQHGITDSSIRDAIEWAYDRQMKDLQNNDKVSLGDWLTSMNKNPDSAPAFLRPFFGSQNQNQPPQIQSTPNQQIQPTPNQQVQQTPPPSNAGVESQTVEQGSLLDRAVDFDVYMANRDRVKEAVYNKLNGGRSPFKF